LKQETGEFSAHESILCSGEFPASGRQKPGRGWNGSSGQNGCDLGVARVSWMMSGKRLTRYWRVLLLPD